MKTQEQVNRARVVIAERMRTPGLNDIQKAHLSGVLLALVWAADGKYASTMERLLSDEPMEPGKDPTEAIRYLNNNLTP